MSVKSIEEVKKQIYAFLEIEKVKNIAIISDNDEDGITSAAQVKQFFDSRKIKSKIFFYNHHTRMRENAKKEFLVFNAEKILCLDLADEFILEIIEDLNTKLRMVVVDHHKFENLSDNKHILSIKPTIFSSIDPSQYPTSKMCYDLFEGRDWLAAIGIIGDSAKITWSAFIQDVIVKYSISEKEMIELVDIVSSIISQHREKISSLFDFLVKTKEPKKLFVSEFAKLNAEFQELLGQEIKRFDSYADNYPELNLSFFRTNYQFTSKLSNMLFQKYPSRTIVIVNHKDNKCNASIRSQNSSVVELRNHEKLIDCSELARKATENIKGGKGGGHVPAAGASFPEESFEEFKAKVIEIVKKKKKIRN